MNINLDLDEKYCETKNEMGCPLIRGNVNTNSYHCTYYDTEIKDNSDGYCLRCPECLAEEKKQIEKELQKQRYGIIDPVELWPEEQKQELYNKFLEMAREKIKEEQEDKCPQCGKSEHIIYLQGGCECAECGVKWSEK